MTRARKTNLSGGFTLVELSIVLIIIAIVAGVGLTATKDTLENARRAATENKLNEIEKALLAFRNGPANRLPCPADITLTDSSAHYGKEAANLGDCVGGTPAAADVSGNNGSSTVEGYPPAVSGGIPTRALNLPDSYMFDGWGRRFVYVVDSHATAYNAFNIIPPNANNCSIWVTDAAAGPRSGINAWHGGAIYMLMSHGPNGHGAYITGSTRISSGSTNFDEQTNCRCDNTAAAADPTSLPYFVQRDLTEDAGDVNNKFDDIVRFKERWQLQNGDDYLKVARHQEYQLVAASPYVVPVAPDHPSNIAYFKRGCDGWVGSRNQADIAGAMEPPAGPGGTATVTDMAFTPDNDYVLMYHYQPSGSNFCSVYDVTGDIPYVTAMACGDYSANNHIAGSSNGYFALGTTTGLQFYQQSGSTFNLLSTMTVSQPKIIALSTNADRMLLANKSDYVTMYGKQGNSFTAYAAASQPYTANLDKIKAAAFSPGDTFLAIAESNTPSIKLWSITTAGSAPFVTGGTSPFTALPSLALGTAPAIVSFSPDGQFLAVGLNSDQPVISDNVKIYKIEGTTFTAATISTAGGFDTSSYVLLGDTTPVVMAWTPDSKTLLIASSECCITSLDLIGGNTFKQTLPPANLPNVIGESTGPTAMAVYH